MKKIILIIMILLFTSSNVFAIGAPGIVNDPTPDAPLNLKIDEE